MTKAELYCKIGGRLPFLWKFTRLFLFGKVDFNDLKEWESEYTDMADIAKLQNRVPEIVSYIINEIADSKDILEVSAGFGNFIGKVDPEKNRVATEYSDQALQALKAKSINAHKATLPVLPFNKNAFDAVVSISVFEHLRNARVIRKSFQEVHRICKNKFILSVPFDSMQPWNTLLHNYDFKKEDIIEFSKGLFYLEKWTVIASGTCKRSISVLRKQNR